MDNITLDILLEFLYNRFAVTFLMCLLGSLIRETMTSSKKNSALNIPKIVASTIFSTFLMCAAADYLKINIPFSIYAVVCILLGMWAYVIIKFALNGKFMTSLLKVFAKSADPIIKDVASMAEKENARLPDAIDSAETTKDKSEKDPGST